MLPAATLEWTVATPEHCNADPLIHALATNESLLPRTTFLPASASHAMADEEVPAPARPPIQGSASERPAQLR